MTSPLEDVTDIEENGIVDQVNGSASVLDDWTAVVLLVGLVVSAGCSFRGCERLPSQFAMD
jgi:hypothetical protein